MASVDGGRRRRMVAIGAGDVLEAPGALHADEVPVPARLLPEVHPALDGSSATAGLEDALQRLRERGGGARRIFVSTGGDAGASASTQPPTAAAAVSDPLPAAPAVAPHLEAGDLESLLFTAGARATALERRVGLDAAAPDTVLEELRGVAATADAVRLLRPGAAEELTTRVERTMELQQQWRRQEVPALGVAHANVRRLLVALEGAAAAIDGAQQLTQRLMALAPLQQAALDRAEAMYAMTDDAAGAAGVSDFVREELDALSSSMSGNAASVDSALAAFAARLELLGAPCT